MALKLVIVLCVLLANTAAAGLTVAGVKCGQKTCKMFEYCSGFDKTCQDCAIICDSSSHNYEEAICENQCQDYLHDARYVSKSETGADLRVTVEKLSRIVTVTLSLVVFMLAVLVSLLVFQLYRWKVKKNITLKLIKAKFFKKGDPASNGGGGAAATTETTNNKRELRLEIPSPSVQSERSGVTVSTTADRRPIEDSVLDYAYDNPAMRKSPNSSH